MASPTGIFVNMLKGNNVHKESTKYVVGNRDFLVKLSSPTSAIPNSPSPPVTNPIAGGNVTYPACATLMVDC